MPRKSSRDLGNYAPFCKIIDFHYHLSDDYPLNRGQNDTWQVVRSHFPLLPEDSHYSLLVIAVTTRPCFDQFLDVHRALHD